MRFWFTKSKPKAEPSRFTGRYEMTDEHYAAVLSLMNTIEAEEKKPVRDSARLIDLRIRLNDALTLAIDNLQ